MRIIEKSFSTKQHGIAEFLSYPERSEPGPALFLIHPKGGLGEYIKTETRKFAQLGYTSFCHQCIRAVGLSRADAYRQRLTVQAKTPDPEFTRVLTEGWRFLLKQATVNKERVAVCGYCMGGRIAIHFVGGDAGSARLRRLLSHSTRRTRYAASADHPTVAARKIRRPSINLYGADDVTTVLPVQEQMWQAFKEMADRWNGTSSPSGRTWLRGPGAPGYNAHTADLSWPLV